MTFSLSRNEMNQHNIDRSFRCPAGEPAYANSTTYIPQGSFEEKFSIQHGEHELKDLTLEEFLKEQMEDFPWLKAVCKLQGHTESNPREIRTWEWNSPRK